MSANVISACGQRQRSPCIHAQHITGTPDPAALSNRFVCSLCGWNQPMYTARDEVPDINHSLANSGCVVRVMGGGPDISRSPATKTRYRRNATTLGMSHCLSSSEVRRPNTRARPAHQHSTPSVPNGMSDLLTPGQLCPHVAARDRQFEWWLHEACTLNPLRRRETWNCHAEPSCTSTCRP